MYCPFCQAIDTKVMDTRLSPDGDQVKRRRECPVCHERFTTFEMADLALPRVIKRDDTRVPFDALKLRNSMLKALEKRKVSINEMDREMGHILKKLYTCGEKEISSQVIGEYVMAALLALDDVAYVRYASVYHRFDTLDAFKREIQRLKKDRG